MKGKVVVVGLDGVTETLLRPWMEAGELPFLRQTMEAGVSGPLTSSVPPVTSPAWPCFMTGKNPGKHGLTWFLSRQGGSYEEVPLDSTSLDSRTLWEILSEENRTVAVLNVPTTYPIRPVNGVMISGFLTPPGKRDFVHPPKLLEELEERFGCYQTDLKTPPVVLVNQTPAAIEKILHEAHQLLDYKFSVAEYVMQKDEFDFFMLHIVEPDRLQHWLWNLLDVTHPHYNGALAAKYRGEVLGYFRSLDSRLAGLAATAGPETTLVLLSDHGFGPCHKGIDLNAWLLQEGYLKIKPDLGSRLKWIAWRGGWNLRTFSGCLKQLLKLRVTQELLTKARSRRDNASSRLRLKQTLAPLFLSMRDIDWSRSRAYCLTGYGQIRINLAGREPQGIVQPGDEYRAVRNEIMEKLERLVDPTTGRDVSARVLAKEDIYWGKHAPGLPDITFLPEENKYVAHTPMSFVSPRVFVDDIELQGFHRMEGILVLRGGPMKKGVRIEGASIMDLAPTILYLLGCGIPDDMDGRVLREVFEEEFLQRNPVEFIEVSGLEESGRPVLSDEDEQGIIERLKGLGYL